MVAIPVVREIAQSPAICSRSRALRLAAQVASLGLISAMMSWARVRFCSDASRRRSAERFIW